MVHINTPMNNFKNNPLYRQVVSTSFAVVGFVALVALGIWLAVYSTRFVPTVINQLGSAAVYLGSVFVPGSKTSLDVVPAASSTTIYFGEATSPNETPDTASTTAVLPKPESKPAVTPTGGKQTSGTYALADPIGRAPYGLPNLTTRITAKGYLATTSTNSFIMSPTVMNGDRPAVNFTIKNEGTNVSGPWRFSASIPTQTAYVYESQNQQSLAPGDSIDYTLGFDQAIRGMNQPITIIANYDSTVNESSYRDNSASTTITILGN